MMREEITDRNGRVIKPGDRVVFQKGANLHSMHPSKDGPYKASRRQTVTVDHLLSASKTIIGHLFPGHPEPAWAIKPKYMLRHAERRGYRNPYYDPYDTGILEFLRPFCEEVERENGIIDLVFEGSKASVQWPGSGGYWIDCEACEVEVVK